MKTMAGILLGTTWLALCAAPAAAATFSEDLDFMKQHIQVLLLSDREGQGLVAIAPQYQGRVMTSTAQGETGVSFGWINRELIASKEIQPHINVYGGEDRFWMGPEGGQFAIFFPKDTPFDLEHWQTPPVIDTEPFELVKQTAQKAVFTRTASFTNWSGALFRVQIDRTIRLLTGERATKNLPCPLPKGVAMVAYESENSLTNRGNKAWEKETGLLSIWILGMFNPTPKTTIVIPFQAGPESERGPKVNDAYFGKVPANKLKVKDDILFFSGDGTTRSKIGLSPQRAKDTLGSYDADNKVLTIVQYTKPEGATEYVNSMWEKQEKPYAGDVVNSYNDGPPEPGKKPLGPFYELETSSPAAALAPNESIHHVHRTYHFQGEEKGLHALAQACLGVSLKEITEAL